ncbi:MAG: hypothetical protein PWQ10_28 [Patescibacteria group bacterium]|nr:hypothetical protein [Patescibacteria group bacterium]
MDLNKYVVNNDSSKSFHSNGFAKVANGDRIGSATPESFKQRRQIDNNRRIIGAYSRSSIGNMRSVVRPMPVIASRARFVKTTNIRPAAQQHNIVAQARRTYNPYA